MSGARPNPCRPHVAGSSTHALTALFVAWLVAPLVILGAGCGTSGGGGTTPLASDASLEHLEQQEAGPEAGADAREVGDAGREAEAGRATWCDVQNPPPAFCDDFDRGAPGAMWDAVVQTTGASLTLDPASYVSPPQSLAMRSKGVSAAEFGSVLLRKTVARTGTRYKLSFDFMADPVPTSGGPVGIATLDADTFHLFTLYLRDEGVDGGLPQPALVEQIPGGGSSRTTFSAPPLGAFARVELEIDLALQRATLRIGTVAVVNQAPIAAGAASQPTVRVGVLATGPQVAYAARFDNVVVDVE
jgi:hypothetical protein